MVHPLTRSGVLALHHVPLLPRTTHHVRKTLISSRANNTSIVGRSHGYAFRTQIMAKRWMQSSAGQNNDQNPMAATKERIRLDHNYCVDLVRDRDREGYLCGLLMPKKVQQEYFALLAFNVELASVKQGSARLRGGADNSTLAVQLKFQRWKDLLDAVYTGSSTLEQAATSLSSFAADPVAASLARAIHDKELTRRFLERLIEAREADVDVVQWNTMQEVTRYAEESVSSRLYLTLECLGIRNDDADIVASHAGVGMGVLVNLRAAPVRVVMGEIPIPVELLPATFPYSILQDLADYPEETTWPDERDKLDWDEAVQQMAMLASGHLIKAQSLQGQIPKAGRSCLLPMVPALHYLSKLESDPINYNVFHPQLRGVDVDRWDRVKMLLVLSRSWLTGVY
ncbi:complex I, assembly factor 6 [Seminavis robusta]|uniref:Complex I, assembly factor 6 n=1 Tax=Seminavis robusta TaxID=568900 RepID=A0A9N8E0R1_9STRA|nr:complex I, assembly factor 6 [Seminavis robusta]|eukprot:Sro434_g142000.1 complex I, assembly factor 6 (398) ;mRNA; r:17607-19029